MPVPLSFGRSDFIEGRLLDFLLNQSWEGSDMRRLLLILLATIPLTGCQFFNRDRVVSVVESVESGEALDGVAAPKIGGKDKPAADSEAFKDPTVKSQPTGAVSTDLIRSTDPAARSRAIARSRVDPFASLPIPPTPDVVVVPVAAAGNSASNTGSGGSTPRATSTPPRTVSGGRSTPRAAVRPAATRPPVRVQPPNRPLVLPSPIAALPTIPQPVIAPTISVSGVIQMGNEPYAIVRSGSEPERYVRVGDRIAGGSVRVKRIETLAFEPRVILEENGIEVSRPIVSGSPAPAADSSSPDGLPVPNVPIPGAQATLPALPGTGGLRALPTPTSSLRSAVPNSLLLPSAESAFQAVLPNFQVPVSSMG
jgi:hypothetical protein